MHPHVVLRPHLRTHDISRRACSSNGRRDNHRSENRAQTYMCHWARGTIDSFQWFANYVIFLFNVCPLGGAMAVSWYISNQHHILFIYANSLRSMALSDDLCSLYSINCIVCRWRENWQFIYFENLRCCDLLAVNSLVDSYRIVDGLVSGALMACARCEAFCAHFGSGCSPYSRQIPADVDISNTLSVPTINLFAAKIFEIDFEIVVCLFAIHDSIARLLAHNYYYLFFFYFWLVKPSPFSLIRFSLSRCLPLTMASAECCAHYFSVAQFVQISCKLWLGQQLRKFIAAINCCRSVRRAFPTTHTAQTTNWTQHAPLEHTIVCVIYWDGIFFRWTSEWATILEIQLLSWFD